MIGPRRARPLPIRSRRRFRSRSNEPGIDSSVLREPTAVARVMEYLASEDVLRDFYSRALFVPGHLGLSAKGVDYPTASPLAKAALDVFTREVKNITPLAYRVKTYSFNQILFNVVI